VTQADASEIIYDYYANGRLEFVTVPGAATYTYGYNGFDTVSSVSSSARDGIMSFLYGGSRARGTLPTAISTSGAHSIPSVWTGTTSGVGSLNGQVYFDYDGSFNARQIDIWGAPSQVRGFNAYYVRDADELVTSIVPYVANTGVPSFWLERSALDGHVSGSCVGGTSYANCMSATPRVSTAYDVDVDALTPGTGDLLGMSASIDSTEVYGVSYVRDDLGRIERLDETIQSTTTTRKYEYDARGRLVRVRDDLDAVVSEYDYDGNGARTRALTSAGEVELGIDLGCGVSLDTPVDAQDRLCRYGDYDYVYDDNGRLATKTQISTSDETAYTYDGLGRLRRVVLPDSTQIDYVHDALGRRIGKVVDGQLEKGWLYGKDSLRPMAQRDEHGEIVMTFVYETRVNVPDYIVDLEAPSKTYRVITDHLGSVRLAINVATGAVVQRMDYDEFGTVLNDTNPGFQPFGFAGGLYDADTGLVRFGSRDYDALTGRWTAKDPILFRGGTTNLYEYVNGDPVNRIDPLGLDTTGIGVEISGGLGFGGSFGASLVGDDCEGGLAFTFGFGAGLGFGAGVNSQWTNADTIQNLGGWGGAFGGGSVIGGEVVIGDGYQGGSVGVGLPGAEAHAHATWTIVVPLTFNPKCFCK
jgi:RHS repeat-associated protein